MHRETIPRGRPFPLVPILVIIWACAAAAGDRIRHERAEPPVSWETRDGRIDHGSVCRDYRRGSIEYRDCRVHAVELFETRCREHTARLRDAGRQAGPALRRRREMYCSAAAGYRPLD
ncbi:hypothetical protein PC39_11954 [Salinisphaera sp. PC39]|uniref:hypothetical protein n=1 Tax=Salinisphaera sp. PC39 TaxID=1304156 RepID=UPI00333E853B